MNESESSSERCGCKKIATLDGRRSFHRRASGLVARAACGAACARERFHRSRGRQSNCPRQRSRRGTARRRVSRSDTFPVPDRSEIRAARSRDCESDCTAAPFRRSLSIVLPGLPASERPIVMQMSADLASFPRPEPDTVGNRKKYFVEVPRDFEKRSAIRLEGRVPLRRYS